MDKITERALLGTILLDSPTSNPDLRIVVARLQAGDFTGANVRYFKCIAEMVRQGKDPDLALIAHQLHLTAEEYAYVAELLDGTPKICNADHYADILKERSALRRQVYLGEQLQAEALSANGNGSVVLARARELLSSHLKSEVGEKTILEFKSGPDRAAQTPEKVTWIVPGYIAAGAITEICGKVKVGKTELIMRMIQAVVEGSDFLGKPTKKTSVLYLTEQPRTSLRESMERAGIFDRPDVFTLSHCEARGLDWPTIAASATDVCKKKSIGLFVVDTLSQFAGFKDDEENNSGAANTAMQPLQNAANEGIAVLSSRHGRKSGGNIGDSGRGSSAFSGAADIAMSIGRQDGNPKTSIRLLEGLSRFSDTPEKQVIELTENGYVSLGEPEEAVFAEARSKILEIAPDTSEESVGEKELIQNTGIAPTTAQRAVRELLKEGLLGRTGKGKRGDPFRYYSPSKKPLSPTSHIEGEKRIESVSGGYPD